ncbi:MAG: carbohydrate porin [Vulcanimicrobiota bacterium]
MKAFKTLQCVLMALLITICFTAQTGAQEKSTSDFGDVWTGSTLSGDWGGDRARLKESGFTFKPRLTQFCQGMIYGDGDHNFKYSSKFDVMCNADLYKLGLWKGLSLNVHGEYNYGNTTNGFGGTMIPVNTAMLFPATGTADTLDLSSVYFQQNFNDSAILMAGKINIIDVCGSKPFMGGAGYETFWNTAFVAPPTGTVPPYLFGALLTVPTKSAKYFLWVYDPNNMANLSGLERPFADGVTIRGCVEFPVTIGGLGGHQGFAAAFSTMKGTDMESLGDVFLPSPGIGKVAVKSGRYHFSYYFDQYLVQSKKNPREGIGLFGQIGFSDGNPNKLDWEALVGIGGTGMIPGRSRDQYGIGLYHYSVSDVLKDALPRDRIRDEQGLEIFYNAELTPWLSVGPDLQIIEPSLKNEQAVFYGFRTVIKF